MRKVTQLVRRSKPGMQSQVGLAAIQLGWFTY